MTEWEGPSRWKWYALMAGLLLFFVAIDITILIMGGPVDPLKLGITYGVLALIYAVIWRFQLDEDADLQYRHVPAGVEEARDAVVVALSERGIDIGGPEERHPGPEWELHLPREGVRVLVLASSRGRTFVMVGPTRGPGAHDVERIKDLLEEALDGAGS